MGSSLAIVKYQEAKSVVEFDIHIPQFMDVDLDNPRVRSEALLCKKSRGTNLRD